MGPPASGAVALGVGRSASASLRTPPVPPLASAAPPLPPAPPLPLVPPPPPPIPPAPAPPPPPPRPLAGRPRCRRRARCHHRRRARRPCATCRSIHNPRPSAARAR